MSEHRGTLSGGTIAPMMALGSSLTEPQTYRVLITDPLPDEGIEILRDAPDVELVLSDLHGDDLLNAIDGFDALIVRSGTAVDRALIERATRLKLVGRAGQAVDNIDIATATARGIMVMNTPEAVAVAAAEHTWALLLAVCRHVPAADRSLRSGQWERSRFMGIELHGKTLGLIGFGRVGQLVAARAHAFGLRVLVADPYIDEEVARNSQVTLVPLDDLLARADLISLHASLTGARPGLIGSTELDRCKPGARLINTAQGSLVDEAALQAALTSGRLAGAGLDVFSQEPPTDSELVSLPTVVATPHLGSSTHEAQLVVARQITAQVLDGLRGHDYRNVVNLPFAVGPDFRLIGPYLALAEKLGSLLAQLDDVAPSRLELEVRGAGLQDMVRPIAVAVLTGAMRHLSPDPVNYVNAPALAMGRGIQITQTRGFELVDYPNLISVRAHWDGNHRLLAGTLFGGSDIRLVQIDHIRMDARPFGPALIMESRDVPGLMGGVGSLLARHQINIAEWRLGRDKPGGMALSLLNLDSFPSDDVLDQLRALPQVVTVRLVTL